MVKRLMVVGAAVLILLGLSCAMLNAAWLPVKAHLKAWSEKDYETAYACFSPELKETISLEDFTTQAEGVLIKSFSLTSVSIKSSTAVVKGTVRLLDGRKWGFRYKLIQQGKNWLIYGYKVSPDVLFEEDEKGKGES
jgi:hypothetical protein